MVAGLPISLLLVLLLHDKEMKKRFDKIVTKSMEKVNEDFFH